MSCFLVGGKSMQSAVRAQRGHQIYLVLHQKNHLPRALNWVKSIQLKKKELGSPLRVASMRYPLSIPSLSLCVCVHEQLLSFISPSRESTFWTGIMTCERKKKNLLQ